MRLGKVSVLLHLRQTISKSLNDFAKLPISQTSNSLKKSRNSKIGVEVLKNKNVFLEGIRINALCHCGWVHKQFFILANSQRPVLTLSEQR